MERDMSVESRRIIYRVVSECKIPLNMRLYIVSLILRLKGLNNL